MGKFIRRVFYFFFPCLEVGKLEEEGSRGEDVTRNLVRREERQQCVSGTNKKTTPAGVLYVRNMQ